MALKAAHKTQTEPSPAKQKTRPGTKSTMKLFLFPLLLLQFAATVETGLVRGERQNVLSFLKEALSTTTEKAIPAEVTGYRNSSSRPIELQDSEDLSDARSTESFETNKYPEPVASDESGGESIDLNSDEVLVPKAEAKEQAPSKRTAQGGKTLRIQGEPQASGAQSHQSSTGGVTGRVNRMYHELDRDRSREMPDWDSLEDKNGRSPTGDESKLTDYDESGEHVSSETYPLKPSSLSAPAKKRGA
ncbi:uncharacterized protein LOC108241977 isoform X2 [Kryptolebias marmoratus]|uniref:uncharacterized protein LOC108241977 isoform X2 n=1 Tax=Kryptolebias marmoratus TaxID=37003 RepID=UPI000D52F6BA|nr:uncharacterized protein LOC108241977 isoform X2 [Kryptolebias marmoratus]